MAIKKKVSYGMSLIEVLVVLSIFMILVALGYSSIMNLKWSTEFKSVNLEFESLVKTIQNQARNNVIGAGSDLISNANTDLFEKKVDAYILFPDYNESAFNIWVCKFDVFTRIYSCSESWNEALAYSEIIIRKGENRCSGIVFENLTGNISIIVDNLSNPSSIEQSRLSQEICDISISHDRNIDTYTTEYQFNSLINNFEKTK